MTMSGNGSGSENGDDNNDGGEWVTEYSWEQHRIKIRAMSKTKYVCNRQENGGRSVRMHAIVGRLSLSSSPYRDTESDTR